MTLRLCDASPAARAPRSAGRAAPGPHGCPWAGVFLGSLLAVTSALAGEPAPGHGATQPAATAADRRGAVLSSDSTRVAYSAGEPGSLDIYVTAADGTRVTRLTDAPGDDFSPAWCTGDSQIVFLSRRTGYSDLYVMRADGAEQRVLASGEHLAYEPTWSPTAPARNLHPKAWMVASSISPTQVRFTLTGTWDREEGRHLTGILSFGDGGDTTFTRVPGAVDHLYPADGRYSVTLRVQDLSRQAAYVFLELTLRTDMKMQCREIAYEKEYVPQPLDR
jgi:hypothetical protein